jgi:hypothetical protein
MTSVDAQSRRATVLFEIAAHADLYEADVAPETPGERLADVIAATDRLPLRLQVMEDHGGEAMTPFLLELAGRVLAWLEADAEVEQKR